VKYCKDPRIQLGLPSFLLLLI